MTESHKHCPICGTPMPLDERFCSQKCENIFLENQRRVQRSKRIFYIILAIFVVVCILIILRGKI
ncbi:MAG: DUF2116 family Zn-ribbon domain-containing protein [Euryarchaeota archaeon]|nr:DUF2116 family Zn-ribbon domain-containing protein [Euryarchaeota archaeon]